MGEIYFIEIYFIKKKLWKYILSIDFINYASLALRYTYEQLDNTA